LTLDGCSSRRLALLMVSPTRTAPSAATAVSRIVLLFGDQEVQHPAAASVRAGAAQVVEQAVVAAAGVFQGVAHDRQLAEIPGLVDPLGHGDDQTLLPLAPRRVEDRHPGGIAEDAAEQVTSFQFGQERGLCTSGVGLNVASARTYRERGHLGSPRHLLPV